MCSGSVAPTTAPIPLSPRSPSSRPESPSTSAARRSCSGRSRRRQVLDVGGARIAGADQGEDPGSGALGRRDQRLQGVEAEQRVGGEGVGPEPRDRPPRGRRLADQRLGVGGGGDRDVAALAVGDRQQPGLAGGVRRPRSSAAQPGAPRRSKQASCGLTATQAGPARSIRRAAVRRATAAAARSAAGASSPPGADPTRQQAWPGRGRGRDRSGCGALRRAPPADPRTRRRENRCSRPLDLGLQGRAGGEAGNLAARNRDPLAGARVDALAGPALGDVEFAEAGEADLATAAQRVGDRLEHGVHGVAGSLLATDPLVARQVGPETQPWSRRSSSSGLKIGRNLTAGSA